MSDDVGGWTVPVEVVSNNSGWGWWVVEVLYYMTLTQMEHRWKPGPWRSLIKQEDLDFLR